MCCVSLCLYVFCLSVVPVRLSVPVQVIDWKDSSPKLSILFYYVKPSLLTHSLTHSSSLMLLNHSPYGDYITSMLKVF